MYVKSARFAGLWLAATSLATSQVVSAQQTPELDTDRPELFSQLVECRQIEEIEQRVACYDEKVDALDQAEADNEVIIADREDVREARRGLFGFKMPKIRLFGGGDEDGEEQIKEVSTAVASARIVQKNWRVRLQNDSLWEQTDRRTLSSRPKPGDTVTIKSKSLGSFLVKIGNNPWVRMRRVE